MNIKHIFVKSVI